MAKYRPIQIRIWKDPDFEKYNANMKLIFIYLCTNELTTESGIYAISIKTISQETGIPIPTVTKLLSNGLKNIAYDFDNSCVFIKNFLKYSVGGSPELIKKSIENNYEEFNTYLWNEFIEKYPEKSKGLQRVNEPIVMGSISNRNRNSNSNSIRNKGDCKGEEKISYADFVSMLPEEYQKLIDKYGETNTKKFIDKLNAFKGSNGKKYKSDYLAILNWVVEAVMGNDKKAEIEKQYQIGLQKEKDWQQQKEKRSDNILEIIKSHINKVLDKNNE